MNAKMTRNCPGSYQLDSFNINYIPQLKEWVAYSAELDTVLDPIPTLRETKEAVLESLAYFAARNAEVAR